ncbi:MAG: NAD(P)/FAD-dependent oxidoreductase [Lewinellaceae bacterium]|nr:NAD(P)/FAD-dependent oxidoreductase [Saprospiraceae bacterium]MCB9340433.1 NAD(P)/FAD-dependent oxidoreductase [Lewinellaceae bacterium]
MKTIANIPDTRQQRIVIVGGGFAGLKLAQSLRKSNYQIVLVDKNNYHQFQPLFYQVATAGLEPSAISFPLRKIFQEQPNVHFRVASLENVDADNQTITTDIGQLHYDFLVLAIGARTNFFGNQNLRRHSVPMKSLGEAINLRNTILGNFELALNEPDPDKAASLLNIVIVGGGPTGVELAGALAEMKKYILPKDYPELDFSKMQIHLLEASSKVLNGYSERSSRKGKEYLERLGVKVLLDTYVKDYDGHKALLANDETLSAENLIWTAGVRGNEVGGLLPGAFGKGSRLLVDEFNKLKGYQNIFVIGDLALMQTEEFPNGHPQVATVAIQQAGNLSKNLLRLEKGQPLKPYRFFNKGSLATVGRNLAVADLPGIRFTGFLAWMLWLIVHLMEILGVKNRLFVFINWAWSYFTYDQSLRLMIRPKGKEEEEGELVA